MDDLDYSDEITAETIELLNQFIPDEDFSAFKIVEGPAW